jgi:hypothetical protein
MVLDSIVCSVSSWPGRLAPQDASENSKFVIPGGGKRGKSLSEAPAELDSLSPLHAFVIARE